MLQDEGSKAPRHASGSDRRQPGGSEQARPTRQSWWRKPAYVDSHPSLADSISTASTNIVRIPRSALNQAYEYALPMHLALVGATHLGHTDDWTSCATEQNRAAAVEGDTCTTVAGSTAVSWSATVTASDSVDDAPARALERRHLPDGGFALGGTSALNMKGATFSCSGGGGGLVVGMASMADIRRRVSGMQRGRSRGLQAPDGGFRVCHTTSFTEAARLCSDSLAAESQFDPASATVAVMKTGARSALVRSWATSGQHACDANGSASDGPTSTAAARVADPSGRVDSPSAVCMPRALLTSGSYQSSFEADERDGTATARQDAYRLQSECGASVNEIHSAGSCGHPAGPHGRRARGSTYSTSSMAGEGHRGDMPDPECQLGDRRMVAAADYVQLEVTSEAKGSPIRQLQRQLDWFSGHQLFLGRFLMRGREHRRRGGAFEDLHGVNTQSPRNWMYAT